jgi:rhodanese-related sulfurtransferase
MENKTFITKSEIEKNIKKGKIVIIIDVRSVEEYQQKHIPNAINIPIEEIEQIDLKLDANSIIVTACGKGGGRSEKSAEILKSKIKNEVYFLEGGTFGWFE